MQRPATVLFPPKQPTLSRSVIAAKDRESALQAIAKANSRETLATIVLITNEGVKLIASKPQLQKTFNFLQYADKFFKEAVRNVNLPMIEAIRYVAKLSKEVVIPEFEKLTQTAQSISVTDENLRLFSELELWLEGLYRHTHDNPSIKKDASGKVIPNKNGSKICIDHEDRILQQSAGISKLDIAEYYGKVAEIIRGKIDEHKKQLSAAPATPRR